MRKLNKQRKIWICDSCYERAKCLDNTNVNETLQIIRRQCDNIRGEVVKSDKNIKTLVEIFQILIETQETNLDSECSKLIKTKVTHEDIRSHSSPLIFLQNKERNEVLLNIILKVANLSSCLSELKTDKRVESVCLAYESIIHARNLNVLTLPSFSKNLRILKETHNKSIINLTGYPSGGHYQTVQALLITELPKLQPPQNDFCSVDDNIQVIYSCCRSLTCVVRIY